MKLKTTKIREEKDKFASYLDKTGLRLTTGRGIVFDEAMHAHGHFTAEELAKQCKQKGRKVSRATVYRSLRELQAAKVIRETAYGDKHQHFEHIYDEKPHHHARCIKCHDIMEIDDLGEDHAYHAILSKAGFKILGHEMHFYGICKKCS